MDNSVLVKNRPSENKFHYLVAEDLAVNAGARNFHECKQALITAYELFYEDKEVAERNYQMRKKQDFLLFWADEHTNFNYAMQWFGMGLLFLAMTGYKFIEVSRWRW